VDGRENGWKWKAAARWVEGVCDGTQGSTAARKAVGRTQSLTDWIGRGQAVLVGRGGGGERHCRARRGGAAAAAPCVGGGHGMVGLLTARAHRAWGAGTAAARWVFEGMGMGRTRKRRRQRRWRRQERHIRTNTRARAMWGWLAVCTAQQQMQQMQLIVHRMESEHTTAGRTNGLMGCPC
jgi:hypothetical protein